MKKHFINLIISIVTIIIFLTSASRMIACDVSTYLKILEAEKKKMTSIPLERTTKELVVGYTSGTKYLVQKLATFFQKEHKGYTAYIKELKELKLNKGIAAPLKGNTANGLELMNNIDLMIVPKLLNQQNNLLYEFADQAITIANDQLVLAYRCVDETTSPMAKMTWQEILNTPSFTIGATKNNNCLSYYTQNVLKTITYKGKLTYTKTGQEVIKKIIEGKADCGFIYKSMATTYSMLMKELPKDINQKNLISYNFAILKTSKHHFAASLFAETMLSKQGFFRLRLIGFTPVIGGEIEFKTK